ncbi:MAG TPA: CRISPR-associated ring nuclease Csm6 [Acidobacteriota bacterium]|nr:CRISPR-associated ring nuclease Csm6 [Acidobacteriota bacterium]
MNQLSQSRRILLCVAGMTPQIVTETLYALTQVRKETVDEIRVITTLTGRDHMTAKLLDPATGRFFAFCRDFGIDPATIQFDETCIALLHAPDGRTFDDIRTEFDNECAANQICGMVRELTRDPNCHLHASIAGGRKTMAVYLTAAMQLFGRAHDRLSHVLVSEGFETHPEFYYLPPEPRPLTVRTSDGSLRTASTAEASIFLADIPYIRLRGMVADWVGNPPGDYGDLVRRTQADLNLADSAYDLRIDFKPPLVTVAGQKVKLPLGQMYIYALFVWYRLTRQNDGFVALAEITVEDLDAVLQWVSSYHRDLTESLQNLNRGGLFGFVHTKVDAIRQNDLSTLGKDFEQTLSKIKRTFEDNRIPKAFLIQSKGERGSLRFGLDLPVERLIVPPFRKDK